MYGCDRENVLMPTILENFASNNYSEAGKLLYNLYFLGFTHSGRAPLFVLHAIVIRSASVPASF
jgi:hypothetical protein